MNARDTILAAIRAAAVPPAPPATPLPPRRDSVNLYDMFLRLLGEVGGKGIVRRRDQTMEQVVSELLGAGQDAAVVIRGRFAVAENGAVYVDADDIPSRDQVVLPEQLVLVVPFGAIVPTMHEAVRMMPAASPCGWFLSGPSKTADIEQSLVYGAQGSRTLCVIFDHAG